MFERYTEKARRIVFFARYEASSFGTPANDFFASAYSDLT
jgi:ATP-dependent Clp protease ATP-binding subunit ClpC